MRQERIMRTRGFGACPYQLKWLVVPPFPKRCGKVKISGLVINSCTAKDEEADGLRGVVVLPDIVDTQGTAHHGASSNSGCRIGLQSMGRPRRLLPRSRIRRRERQRDWLE